MTVVPRRRKLSPAAQRFWAFHHANPVIYETLLALARRAKDRGLTRISIRMLWDRMRYEMLVEVRDPNYSTYALNDHYTSRYARLMIRENPDLDGFFEMRGDVDL